MRVPEGVLYPEVRVALGMIIAHREPRGVERAQDLGGSIYIPTVYYFYDSRSRQSILYFNKSCPYLLIDLITLPILLLLLSVHTGITIEVLYDIMQ